MGTHIPFNLGNLTGHMFHLQAESILVDLEGAGTAPKDQKVLVWNRRKGRLTWDVDWQLWNVNANNRCVLRHLHCICLQRLYGFVRFGSWRGERISSHPELGVPSVRNLLGAVPSPIFVTGTRMHYLLLIRPLHKDRGCEREGAVSRVACWERIDVFSGTSSRTKSARAAPRVLHACACGSWRETNSVVLLEISFVFAFNIFQWSMLMSGEASAWCSLISSKMH